MQFEFKNFDTCFGVLSKSVFVIHPAEIHGTMAGLICMNFKQTEKSWFNTILKSLEARVGLASKEKSEVMVNLYDKTLRQLLDEDDNFQLLLPGEESTLKERAYALNSWCRGFMYAFNFADTPFVKNLTEDGLLALGSIFNLANLDLSKIEIHEKDQEVFFHAIRYIQNSVLVLYDELSEGIMKSENKITQEKYLH